jgi:hypothetical protein
MNSPAEVRMGHTRLGMTHATSAANMVVAMVSLRPRKAPAITTDAMSIVRTKFRSP